MPAVLAVGLGILGVVWQFSDPRSDIKALREDLHTNYLSIREHEEYKKGVDNRIDELRAAMVAQHKSALQRIEFDHWLHERDQRDTDQDRHIIDLSDRIRALNDRVFQVHGNSNAH